MSLQLQITRGNTTISVSDEETAIRNPVVAAVARIFQARAIGIRLLSLQKRKPQQAQSLSDIDTDGTEPDHGPIHPKTQRYIRENLGIDVTEPSPLKTYWLRDNPLSGG